MTQKNHIFLFFVCISMFKNALHLHHREGDSEQTGGQAQPALKYFITIDLLQGEQNNLWNEKN